MAIKYWIGDQYVDPSRNQIIRRETVQTLAPKALSVLTLLAKNQGSVVTQEALLDSVWKGTIVSPNTLQRSIAQLRKAFGDDAKQQRVIKTHSKQGYSLELQVKWHDDDEVHGEFDKGEAPTPRASAQARKLKLMFAAIAATLLLGIVVLLKSYQGEQGFSITSIQAMTATDNKEFNAIYSADGEYIIFNRYHEKFCRSRIWAKHVGTQQETLLTSWGNYGSISLSPDDTRLAFIQKETCQPPLPATPCFSLKSLDFQKALEGNTAASTLMTCSIAQIKNPLWLSDDTLVLMHMPSNQWQLLKYSTTDSSSEILYQPQSGAMLSFDMAPKLRRIALINLDESNRPILEILSTDGELLLNNSVQEHPDISKHKLFYPRFVPNESMLMFSTGRLLFSLSYEGDVQRIMLPLDEAMGTPLFAASGKKALAIKGIYDSDIGIIDLSKIDNSRERPISEQEVTNIARSNSGDEDAIFQPGGQIVAFISERTGSEQLWLSEDGTLTQLTELPLDSRIGGFRWSIDGKSLLLNTDGQLLKLHLNGVEHSTPMNQPVTNLFHWNSDTNTAIANIRVKGNEVLAKLNLETGDYVTLGGGSIVWAAESTEGRLIYLDRKNQYWQSEVAEDILISPLLAQGSDKRFILADEIIYGVNEDYQLWTYDLEQQLFTHLGTLPASIDYLTDIHKDNLLLTYVVAAKKEIVELTLGD